MKTLIATIALAGFMSTSGMASEGSKETKESTAKTKTEQRIILNPRQEALFKSGRLAETIITPIYTSADQLVFTAMVKNLKVKN